MKNKFIYLLFLLLINNSIFAQLREVIVPISDLKNRPVETIQTNINYPVFSKQTPFQNTQLLFGEYVYSTGQELLLENENWIEIEAIEQTKCDGSSLESIKGWIKENDIIPTNSIMKKNLVLNKKWATVYSIDEEDKEPLIKLSIGTKLIFIGTNHNKCLIELPNEKKGFIKATDACYHINFNMREKQLRKNILKTSIEFLGMPYSWGGRSALNSEYPGQTSIDCSGFINLLYRVAGLQISRDAKDQYKYCNPIEYGPNLKPGDLIFLANANTPEKINHVMLYLREELLQESIGFTEPYSNRIITFQEKFGVTKDEIISEEIYNNKIIYLASVLNDKTKIQEMRKLFLNLI